LTGKTSPDRIKGNNLINHKFPPKEGAMSTSLLSSQFLEYLAHNANASEQTNQLPSLMELSKQLGVSVSRLREQMEVARALGLIDVKPRTGIRRLPYTFFPAVRQSLSYAIALDRHHFEEFSDLRQHIEATYWHPAVSLLTPDDLDNLDGLVARAWKKLYGNPIQIPHEEHRELHLSIFHRLRNPFVSGILEAYWDAYEEVGLNVYADYHYLEEVWKQHQKMVEAIRVNDFETGHRILIEHNQLIYARHGPFSRDDRPRQEGDEPVLLGEPGAELSGSSTSLMADDPSVKE
jgi:DNA-binding FadR family transcriptional regulator